jgi:hypothetical protein
MILTWLHDLERSQEHELDTAENAGERRFVRRDLRQTRAAVEGVERNEREREKGEK